MAAFGRKRAEFCGIGGELVEDHRNRLTRLCAQDLVRPADLQIAARGVGCELALHELGQRNPLPAAAAQQLSLSTGIPLEYCVCVTSSVSSTFGSAGNCRVLRGQLVALGSVFPK